MSAVAVAPAVTSSSLAPNLDRHVSPREFAAIAPSSSSVSAIPTSEPAAKRARSNGSPGSGANTAPAERASSTGKTSPNSLRTGPPPMIKVKKEPGSPAMQTSRPRPKRLDLSSSMANARGPQTARPSGPLTSRDSAGLAIQDVGLACLSPGFATHDPAMREQLQRSLDVRDQQRQIIEARQKGQKPGSAHEASAERPIQQDNTFFGVPMRTPTTSRRKGPPPGLSISAPSAAQFANDRVIQSAPMHQTFTGLRPGEHPFSRHVQHGPSGLSQTSHIHHVPATQTNNRLPPIADVFANDRLDAPRYPGQSPQHSSHSNIPPPVPSPGFPPPHHSHHQHAAPLSSREREFTSADEAVRGLSGGREDLMPKLVHYGGAQPPTPPSPMPRPGQHQHQHQHLHQNQHQQSAPGAPQQHPPSSSLTLQPSADVSRPDILARTSSMNGRRRGRDEYERDNGSSPSEFHNRSEAKRAAFGPGYEAGSGVEEREREIEGEEDWRRGMSGREKREEFLRLCEKAWDLFHS
ncbi:hypothetical protein LTR78_009050 [Recurvomyces mirabilis]|uniref:Uncharacterized protein n=1 Tax=Recurvomyces mirabilis TaxID=574656 RepID=A0AAE0TQA1_9PEZI|nr:hypothetical protein LTR78_009050 [Recurvomyces mirabilis]KAK5150422.1 hypothetical protein LTS14_010112 [Recurvomyces mirabilis]